MATPAFDLDPPVRHIIHTVGPIWEGGGYGEADVLASCYRRSLQVADHLGARTVAFPAIATGVYAFPPEDAARIAVHTIAVTPTNVVVSAWSPSTGRRGICSPPPLPTGATPSTRLAPQLDLDIY